jgi:hypothetical protein
LILLLADLERIALVGADHHHDRVRLVLAHLVGRELAPVDQEALGDARPEMRVADHLHALGREQPRELGVHRLRQRVAGHQQRLQRLLARRRLIRIGRVERVGRDRRDAGVGHRDVRERVGRR